MSTATLTAVPFLDLKAQYRTIRADVTAALEQVMQQTAFVLGPAVKQFETSFAAYCGATQCVAVSSGTAALHVAMAALGIGPGDEVIVPAMTFVATAWPVLYLGATPVFVDVDPRRYTLDPAKLAAAITRKTKAIVPVHLYGQCANLGPILELAAAHDIPVLEDAAQAHGATYQGQRAGSWGRMGCFSFYPGKNLGAYGEGGAVVTSDPELAQRIRMLRDHGAQTKYQHETLGYNYRMEGFQGAVLSVKLRHLDAWNAARRKAAAQYDTLLREFVQTPAPCPDGEHVYHVYAVCTPQRDTLRTQLEAAGIGVNMHYPIPVHLLKPFAKFGYTAGSFPVAEQLAKTELSLPMFPEISTEQIETVAAAVRAVTTRSD
jgi:dTDP-4-amino-4,6-dideoxygalactose transaminase